MMDLVSLKGKKLDVHESPPLIDIRTTLLVSASSDTDCENPVMKMVSSACAGELTNKKNKAG